MIVSPSLVLNIQVQDKEFEIFPVDFAEFLHTHLGNSEKPY